MGILQAFLLSLIQGLTEFLPISSSAHLVLLPIIMEWQDQGLVIDIAAHVGSLLAVILYFRTDIRQLISGWLASLSNSSSTDEHGRIAWLIIYASLPIMFVALLFHAVLLEHVRNAVVIGVASIVFAVLLWIADRNGKQYKETKHLTIIDSILIGIGQAFAIIPGASRSGVTITAGMWLGLSRIEAAKFSFLLAIPTILVASAYGFYCAFMQHVNFDWGVVIFVVISSAIFAYLCIHWFLKLVKDIGMLPFVIYRIILGLVLIVAYL